MHVFNITIVTYKAARRIIEEMHIEVLEYVDILPS